MNETASSDCYPQEPFGLDRLIIVLGIGCPMATIGTFTNAVIFCLFLQRRYRNSPYLYLALLALLDIVVSLLYNAMFTTDAVGVYFKILPLYRAYHSFILWVWCASRMIQLGSIYLVVCATVERYLLVSPGSCGSFFYSNGGRRVVVFWVFLVSCLWLPTYWEAQVVRSRNCSDPFASLTIVRTQHLPKWYWQTYSFYIMQIIQEFVPFTLLTVLNLGIVHWMSKQHNERRRSLSPASLIWKSKKQLRAATMTMVCLVTSYLVCRILSVFIRVLEFVDNYEGTQPLLYQEKYVSTNFYRLSTDFISLLFLFNSFIRIFIYACCDAEIRYQLLCWSKAKATHEMKYSFALERATAVGTSARIPVHFATTAVYENSSGKGFQENDERSYDSTNMLLSSL